MLSFHTSVHARSPTASDGGEITLSGQAVRTLLVPPEAVATPFAVSFEEAGAALAVAGSETIRRRLTTTRLRSTCRRSCATSDDVSSADDHEFMPALALPLTTFASLADDAARLERSARALLEAATRIGDSYNVAKAHMLLCQSSGLQFDLRAMREHRRIASELFVEIGELLADVGEVTRVARVAGEEQVAIRREDREAAPQRRHRVGRAS